MIYDDGSGFQSRQIWGKTGTVRPRSLGMNWTYDECWFERVPRTRTRGAFVLGTWDFCSGVVVLGIAG
jgi:hypothetical protein